MKGDWPKIMNLVHGVRKISDIYLDVRNVCKLHNLHPLRCGKQITFLTLDNYGELGAPPEIVVDPSLDN
jgi:hypothetical protein